MQFVELRYLQALAGVAKAKSIASEQQGLLESLSKEMNDLSSVWNSATQVSLANGFYAKRREILDVLIIIIEGLQEMHDLIQKCYSMDQNWHNKIKQIL